MLLAPRGIVEAMTDPTEALAERASFATPPGHSSYTIYLGERLGLYRALHEGGPATSGELAARVSLRPVGPPPDREWPDRAGRHLAGQQ